MVYKAPATDALSRFPTSVRERLAADLADPATELGASASATFATATIVAPGVSGVVGDGATDDTTAIQALIDAAGTGGTIMVYRPTGGQDSYLIAGTLTITNSNVRILGAGRDVYAANFKKSSGSTPIIEVKAPGFVMRGMGLVGNGGANGAGATMNGLDLYGSIDGDIDAFIDGCSFQYLDVGVYVRARNAVISGNLFSNGLGGVVLDGIAAYHTGGSADQNRGNTIHANKFHNIGNASTDAAIEITTTAKVLHALVSDNYFDSNGLGQHVMATGTVTNKHEKITCQGNKHTEASAAAYAFTYVNNSTISNADISGYATTPADFNAVNLINCNTITVSGLFVVQAGTSGIYGRSNTYVRVKDCVFRSLGIYSGTTGHGLDFDSTNSTCRFDRVTVETTDGWGFIGEPASSAMSGCDFQSCTLGLLNSLTLTNLVSRGMNTFTEGRYGRLEDQGQKVYDFSAGVIKQVATVLAGTNYGSAVFTVEFTARDSVTGTCYVFARRYFRPENGTPTVVTIGTDSTAEATLTIGTSGTTGVTVSITTTRLVYGSVVVRASAGGSAGATNSRGVTVTMA